MKIQISILALSLVASYSAQAGWFARTTLNTQGTCVTDDGAYRLSYKSVDVGNSDEYIYTRNTVRVSALKGSGEFDGTYIDGADYFKPNQNIIASAYRMSDMRISVKVPRADGTTATLLGACKTDARLLAKYAEEKREREAHPEKYAQYQTVTGESFRFTKPLIMTVPAGGRRALYVDPKTTSSEMDCSSDVNPSNQSKYGPDYEPIVAPQTVVLNSAYSDSKGFLVFEGETQNEWIRVVCTSKKEIVMGDKNRALPSQSEEVLREMIKGAFPKGVIQ